MSHKDGDGVFGGDGASGTIFRTMREAQQAIRELDEARAVVATEGARMTVMQGRRVRVPGVVIYDSNYKEEDFWKVLNNTPGFVIKAKITKTRVTLLIAFGQAVLGTDGFGRVDTVMTIAADGRKIWTNSNPSASDNNYESIEIHKGGSSMAVSPIFDAIKGTGKTPAFRNTVYVAIADLKLEKFGNVTPLNWEAIIRVKPLPYSVADAISDHWARTPGRVAGELDVSAASGANTSVNGDASEIQADGQFEGAIWEGPTTPRQALSIIEGGYNLWHRERAGVLSYHDRGDEEIYPVKDLLDSSGVIIGCADCGTSEGKASSERPILFRNPAKVNKVPTEVVVGFYSKKMEYQRDSTRKRLKNDAETAGVNIVQIDLPLVLTQKASRRIAAREIAIAHKDVIEGNVQLPPDYIDAEVNDILALVNSEDDQRYYLRIDQLTLGSDFMVQIEGQVVEVRGKNAALLTSIPSVFQGTDEPGDIIDPADDAEPGVGDPDAPDDDDVYFKQAMLTRILSVPAMSNVDAQALTWLFAHAFVDHGAQFEQATVYRSNDASTGFSAQNSTDLESEYPVGTALTALPAKAGAALGAYLDTNSTVQISMNELGTALSTITDQDLVQTSLNRFLIGNEIIQARDIAVVSAVSASDSMTVSASASQVTRSVGSWVTDGFKVGQVVRFKGFTNNAIDPIENDRVEVVTAIGGGGNKVMTLTQLQGATWVDEGPTASVTATALESGTAYQLSHLIRGLRDTRDHHDGHVVLEAVLRYDPALVVSVALADGKYNKTLYYRSVPEGSTKNDPLTVTTSALADGESLRQFRPAHVHYLRGDQYTSGADVENIVRIRWVHQTRDPEDDVTASAIHGLLGETNEKYDIEVYSDSGLTTLKASYRLKFTDHVDVKVRRWTYTQAAQVGDGLSVGGEFWVRIRHRQLLVKEGNWSDTLHVKTELSFRPPTAAMAAAASTEGTVI